MIFFMHYFRKEIFSYISCLEVKDYRGGTLKQSKGSCIVEPRKTCVGASPKFGFIFWIGSGYKQPTVQTMLTVSKALNCSMANLAAEAEVFLAESAPLT